MAGLTQYHSRDADPRGGADADCVLWSQRALAQADLGYSGSIYSWLGYWPLTPLLMHPGLCSNCCTYSGLTQSQWQNAQMLGLNSARTFQLLDWPLIRARFASMGRGVPVVLYVLCGGIGVGRLSKWATLEVRLSVELWRYLRCGWGGLDSGWAFVPWFTLTKPQFKTLYSQGAPVQRPVSEWGTGLWVLVSAIWLGPMLALGLRASQVDWIALLQPILSQALITSLIIGVVSAATAAWDGAGARSTGYAVGCLGLAIFPCAVTSRSMAMFLISKSGVGQSGCCGMAVQYADVCRSC